VRVPSCFDRKDFFLCDSLPFEEHTILPSEEAGDIKKVLLMLRIGCSRVLSYSMFIEALVELKELLRYDQMIEVCFYASLLNSPVLFHHIVMNLIARHKDSKEDFKFGKHPVYDILDATMTLLGNNSETDSSKIKWQSGFEPKDTQSAEQSKEKNKWTIQDVPRRIRQCDAINCCWPKYTLPSRHY